MRATNEDKMYSGLCNIGQDPNKLHLGKPKYILMDASVSQRFDGKGVLILYKTNKNSSFCSSRKLTVSLTVFVTFVLGFFIGSVIPIHFTAEKISSIQEQTDKSTLVDSKSNFIAGNSTKIKNVFVHNGFIDGIFWSEYVEKSLPQGYGDNESNQWKDFVANGAIVRLENGCGRMQNRMVIFSDGTKSCCRYRPNTDQIQGEIFSYHLGRLLGIRNLVPSALTVVNRSEPLWQAVAAELGSADWSDGRPVVLTRYVEDLLPANIPKPLRHVLSTASTTKPSEARNTLDIGQVKTDQEAVELAQWSDLIVFDYLTGNLDRVVNNLYNLQWNRNMLDSPTHNLARTTDSRLLVFLDNESGLLHGYRLLNKYEPYHSLLLEGLCVFRRSTVDALAELQSNSVHLPTSSVIPSLPDKNFDILQQRLGQVLHQVLSCVRHGRWHN